MLFTVQVVSDIAEIADAYTVKLGEGKSDEMIEHDIIIIILIRIDYVFIKIEIIYSELYGYYFFAHQWYVNKLTLLHYYIFIICKKINQKLYWKVTRFYLIKTKRIKVTVLKIQ